jgi:hypothetical protein
MVTVRPGQLPLGALNPRRRRPFSCIGCDTHTIQQHLVSSTLSNVRAPLWLTVAIAGLRPTVFAFSFRTENQKRHSASQLVLVATPLFLRCAATTAHRQTPFSCYHEKARPSSPESVTYACRTSRPEGQPRNPKAARRRGRERQFIPTIIQTEVWCVSLSFRRLPRLPASA